MNLQSGLAVLPPGLRLGRRVRLVLGVLAFIAATSYNQLVENVRRSGW